MVGGILIDIIVIICAFWFFFDAANHNVGVFVVGDGIEKGYRKGLSPVVWGALSLLILPFFLYLIRRKSLLAIAKTNPSVTDKSTGFIILFILSSAWELYAYRNILFL